jgi:phosphatidylserine/phosphatidylglycerophosphate/cardiolipin synthase-like enzyme
VLKDEHANPQAVLMGSANFTPGGVSLQNNVSHIIENPTLAQKYRDTFELLIEEDNEALYEPNAHWQQVGPDIEVNFSPHRVGERTDLDRFVELVRGARSNTVFCTLRPTDEDLIRALVEPKDKNVVVRGLVDKVYERGDEVLLYHHAHDRDPDIAPATNALGTTDPLTRELGRSGYKPIVHHKFIVIDYGRPECAVITGSANYSKNSSKNNDENTLVVRRDQRIAQMYLGEFHRIYEHHRARWFINREGKRKPSEVSLKEDGRWAKKYYDGSESERFFRVLLQ